jgi:hypothetical protein
MRIVRLIEKVSDAMFPHDRKRNRKLVRMVFKRAEELQRMRNVTKDESIAQATKELKEFNELFGLDADSINDLLFAEENFPLSTKSLDARAKRNAVQGTATDPKDSSGRL